MSALKYDDDQLCERYFERCALQEYDGGLTRLEATELNFAKMDKWCKNQGREVPAVVIEDLETVKRNVQRGK